VNRAVFDDPRFKARLEAFANQFGI